MIDLSLGRIEGLLARLGHPERALPPVIHVAGTNGKGSTVAFLRAIYEAAGMRVHAYTSPHLVRFHERIRVAGQLIAEDALIALLEECERVNGRDPITFFEVTTAAAFLAFAREPADVCLLETGLGGRLDATNVVARPVLTALTPISLDHQHYLGPDLGSIAAEKAGILKHGVSCVVAAQERAAMRVIADKAKAAGAPLSVEGPDWHVRRANDRMIFTSARGRRDLPPPALSGPHQIHNAALAVACVEAAPELSVPDGAVALGLSTVRWPGRMQRLDHGPLAALLPPGQDGWELWLDGAHNPGAGRMLAGQARVWRDAPLYVILGMMNTRDPAEFLKPFAARIRHLIAVPIPGQDNALPAEAVHAVALRVGVIAATAPDVATAVRAITLNHRAGRILIAGSLYLAGSVLAE